MEAGKYDIGEISGRLKRVRALTVSLGAVSAVVRALLVLALSWLVVSLLDIVLGLPWGASRAVAIFGAFAALGALAYRLSGTLGASQSIRRYAARVGRELEDIGLDLLTALDLAEADSGRLGYSGVLINRTIEGITAKVRSLDLTVAVRRRALLVEVLVLLSAMAAGGLWRAVGPDSFAYSLARMKFFLGLTAESGVGIHVSPGDLEIAAGEPLEIRAEVEGFVESDAVLHIISDGEETRFKMARAPGPAAPGARTFTSGIARIEKDLDYFVSVSGERTRTYRVSVFEHPRITGGVIRLTPPAYTGLRARVAPEGVWDVTALFGTRADFALATSAPADSVRFVVEEPGGGRSIDYFTLRGDSAGYTTNLVDDFTYSLEIVAAGAETGGAHGPHSVRIVQDEPPYVRIESPAKEMLLEADMLVPLSVRALDDYGISLMRIGYKTPAESGHVDLPYTGKTEARCDYNWDVGALDVFPGEAVYYYVEVADNDALKGPKFARTATYVARVPTPYDVYREIEDRQEDEVADLEEVAEELEKAAEAMDDLADDLKRGEEMDWEKEQAMKKGLDRQSELASDIEDIVSSMDETLDMMSESDLVSFEVIAKMEEIRRLLDEVATEEFMQALERMREAMKQLAPEDIEQAMRELDLSQEDLMRRLDATIEMLKRLKLEQDMDAVESLAEKILDGEKAVNEGLERGGDLEEAAETERGLRDDLEGLAGMMDQLGEDLRAAGERAAGEVEEAGEFMESRETSRKMDSKASSMSRGERQQALSTGQDIQSDLEELNRMISDAKMTLQGGLQKEILDALTDVMNGLREVSARHEDVMAGVADGRAGVDAADLARREMVYKEALDRAAERLFEVSKMSPFIPPELAKTALAVGENMEKAAGDLHEGRGGRAAGNMKTALGYMNALIASIAEATDKASSCSSSSSMCDAMNSLQNMSCRQMGINMGTQELFNESGGLSMEARAQMARLAAEQESVRKGLEEMMREYGNRGEILGRMDDLIEEARRVIRDLESQRVSEETIRGQEKILTRLLNMQKSLRQRDYSRRRKSKPGEEYAVKPPPELTAEEREKLVEDILYRRRGSYPPEYEDLIRAYIKAISRHE